MEDTLRGNYIRVMSKIVGLNPCFNGRYSQSMFYEIHGALSTVLILVLMEDTLRDKKKVRVEDPKTS